MTNCLLLIQKDKPKRAVGWNRTNISTRDYVVFYQLNYNPFLIIIVLNIFNRSYLIQFRLVKKDLLIRGIEEAYTKNCIFGKCIGSLQCCFKVMTVTPNTINANIHRKKGICEKVKETLNEISKRCNLGSKTKLIYDAFY